MRRCGLINALAFGIPVLLAAIAAAGSALLHWICGFAHIPLRLF
jgi:hypothetical protein